MLKPFDKQPVAVERAETFRADDSDQASCARPFTNPIEKRSSCVLIVLTFKEVKLGLRGPVILIEGLIDQYSDAPHHAAISPGDEKVGVGVFVKWMLMFVQHQLDVHAQRWNPLWMIIVQAIWNIDEAADVPFVLEIDLIDS